MYFLKANELAKDLKKGIVTEREQMIYYIIVICCSALLTSGVVNFYVWSSVDYLEAYDYVLDALTLAFSILLPLYCYKINSAGDGQKFVERITCLSIPVAVQSTLFAVPVAAIWIVIALTFDGSLENAVADSPDLESLQDEQIPLTAFEQSGAVGITFIILMFTAWRMTTAFKIATGTKHV